MSGDEAICDTSAFIAIEQGRPIRQTIPSRLFVSVVTAAELRLGVLTAASNETMAKRLRTLTWIASLETVPVDETIAMAWAEMKNTMKRIGKKLATNDSWIAATAIAHGMPVATQNNDYDDVPGLDVIKL